MSDDLFDVVLLIALVVIILAVLSSFVSSRELE